MTPEDMKALVRRVMDDGFNKGDLTVVDGAFHADYVRHGHAGQVGVNSLEEHKAALVHLRRQFLDAKFLIEDMVAEGDCVAVRFALEGRHAGEVLGIAPTGRTVRRMSTAFFYFRGDRIAEGYILSDVYGLLQQLRTDPA